MVGITQVCSWSYENSVKHHIDQNIKSGVLNKEHVKTAYVGPETKGDGDSWGFSVTMTEEERNQQIIEAIRKLLSPNEKWAALSDSD
jgi:hypothetical protein